jgi:hypothetical protein
LTIFFRKNKNIVIEYFFFFFAFWRNAIKNCLADFIFLPFSFCAKVSFNPKKKKKKMLLKKTILLEEPKHIPYTHASTRPGRAATGPIRPDPTRAGAPRLQSVAFLHPLLCVQRFRYRVRRSGLVLSLPFTTHG